MDEILNKYGASVVEEINKCKEDGRKFIFLDEDRANITSFHRVKNGEEWDHYVGEYRNRDFKWERLVPKELFEKELLEAAESHSKFETL